MKTISEMVNKIAEVATRPFTRTTRPREVYAGWLEKHGFLRSVAGEHDFNAVTDAMFLSIEKGRGIFFTGGVGVGKTKAMQIIHDHMVHDKTWIDCYDATTIENLPYWNIPDLCVFVDDIGSERFKYGDYDVVGEAICKWHGHHNEDCRLFATSNLTGDEIVKRYGGRLFDRLGELCVICRLTGESKRKQEVVG